MTESPHPSPDTELEALIEGTPAPPGPARPPWGAVAALVGAGGALLGLVLATWPGAAPSSPTGWPDPPRPAVAPLPGPPALPSITPTPCSGDACAVQRAHPTWPPAICAAVAEERAALGMTGAQVRSAWGEPAQIEGDRWCYDAECARGVRFVADRAVELLGL